MDAKFFLPFETAKLLKEKGYPQEGATMYYDTFSGGETNLITDRECVSCIVDGNVRHPLFNRLSKLYIAAPTYHEVLDWLEGKGYPVEIMLSIECLELKWFCAAERIITPNFDTREEAINACILAALKML